MKHQLLILGLILVLTSCATTSPKPVKRKLTERERILEYYRLLRKKKSSRSSVRNKRVTVRPKKVKKYKIKMVDISEQKVEIEQRLVFFCMENRKSKRFSADKSCEEYTKNILMKCNGSFISGDTRLTRCVKSRLK
ncbi:MAG: hypothetical protein BM556_01035 [Bacteriovorax sp. MedPE-SWde]|nr:MAG: hypothetical protein BM556_01035 [Bacteriovorax sp. MedPE-SWde]